MIRALLKFNPKLPKLSADEQKVLKLLVEAGKLIEPLYLQQENNNFPGANFYPHGISKKEIEKAAVSDPDILSPYTVVERKDGKLLAVPYHVKYAKYLKPIADRLNQAAAVSKNKEFAKRLAVQAEALLNGNYEKAMISWITMKPYVLDINLGPVERYDDKLFFIKTSYQAWVGVMDWENTEKVNKYKNVILGSRRKILVSSQKVDYYDKVQTRVDDVLIFSGLKTRTMAVGTNVPNDVNFMEKYGSEITVFKQSNHYRVKNEIIPAFNKIFSPEFKKTFTAEDLEVGCSHSIILHELAHTYLRYRDSEKNLQDLFPIIDELAASVMGIKVCGSLLLKDVMTQKQLESIMVAFMARNFYLVLAEKENLSRLHYILGGAIFINYLLESGAVKEAGGISWPNFTKMFVSLDELASILERLLYQGTRDDAETFIKKYDDIKKLQRFAKPV